jgi:hypothetical protein
VLQSLAIQGWDLTALGGDLLGNPEIVQIPADALGTRRQSGRPVSDKYRVVIRHRRWSNASVFLHQGIPIGR